MKEAIKIYYSGKVQGVGFRWQTNRIAKNFAVTGYVMNLPDGRVEVHVEGKSDEIEAFILEIQKQMQNNISSTEQEKAAMQPFTEFVIKR